MVIVCQCRTTLTNQLKCSQMSTGRVGATAVALLANLLLLAETYACAALVVCRCMALLSGSYCQAN
jgi:hypothetical protein